MGRRDTLLLSILTLVTAFAWVAFDVYHAYVTTTISPDVEAQLSPVTPKFDRAVIERIKTRQNIEPLESGEAILPSSPSGVQTATPSGGV